MLVETVCLPPEATAAAKATSVSESKTTAVDFASASGRINGFTCPSSFLRSIGNDMARF